MAAVAVLGIAAGGLYFGLSGLGDDDGDDSVTAAAEDGELGLSSGIEPIINGDITDALTSEIVYTDEVRGLDYTRPIIDIEDRTGQISIPMSEDALYKPEERPEWVQERYGIGQEQFGNREWAVRIFADPDLTVEVGADTFRGPRVMEISPTESARGAIITPDEDIAESDDVRVRENFAQSEGSFAEQGEEDVVGQWGLRDTYYVVRYVSDDGRLDELERPVVAKLSFTQSLPTPAVDMGVSDEYPGYVELSWNEVPGASSYGVFVSFLGDDNLVYGRTQVRVGQTEGTSWTPAEEPTTSGSVQNFGLRTGLPAEHHRAWRDFYSRGTEYGVIAYDASGEKMSALGTVSANISEIESLPYEVDYDTINDEYKEMGCRVRGVLECTIEDLPVHTPYVSIAGETRTGLSMAVGVEWNDSFDGYAAVVNIESTNLYLYRPLGTTDEAEATKMAEDFNERATGERQPTGGISVAERETAIDTSVEAVAGVDDVVLAKVNADHELVAYIAAHMYEGHTAIDMRDYATFWKSSEVTSAANAAAAQNPALGVWSSTYSTYDLTLHVEYRDREEEQQALDEVRSIVEGLGVENMTDTQKVEAINQHIVAHVEYDHAALESAISGDRDDPRVDRSQTLAGAVFDGITVCAGYSKMFLVMANEAGLDAVYVSGTTEQSLMGHAWNKVKIDGEWKAVDSTWNDTGSRSSDEYLLINDSDFTGHAARSEGSSWVFGSPSRYATP